jgi:hypothetical protein
VTGYYSNSCRKRDFVANPHPHGRWLPVCRLFFLRFSHRANFGAAP